MRAACPDWVALCSARICWHGKGSGPAECAVWLTGEEARELRLLVPGCRGYLTDCGPASIVRAAHASGFQWNAVFLGHPVQFCAVDSHEGPPLRPRRWVFSSTAFFVCEVHHHSAIKTQHMNARDIEIFCVRRSAVSASLAVASLRVAFGPVEKCGAELFQSSPGRATACRSILNE